MPEQRPSVVGALRAEEWRVLGAPRWQYMVARDGLRWPVREPQAWESRRPFRLPAASQRVVDDKVCELMAQGALERGAARLTHPMFLVPKAPAGWRLVIDMRELNKFCAFPAFRFETFARALEQVQPGDVMATFDLRSGYHHVPLHPALRELMGVRWRGEALRFTCLPFGWNVAPYVFTRMVAPFVAALRARGVRVSPYLDDFLLVGASAEELRRTQAEVVEPLLRRFGWQRAPEKGTWEPSTRVRFLGLEIDSAAFRVRVPADKIARLAAKIRDAVEHPQRAWTARRLASLAGTLLSVSRAWPMVRAGLWALFALMREAVTQKGWRATTTLSRETLSDLRFLQEMLPGLRGAPIRETRAAMELYTDASDVGWGAVFPARRLATAGRWTDSERKLHIQIREALATERALATFGASLHGSRLELVVDNAALAAYLSKGGGYRARHLGAVVRRTMRALVARDIEFGGARWIPSAANGEADFLSRFPEQVTRLAGWTAVPATTL